MVMWKKAKGRWLMVCLLSALLGSVLVLAGQFPFPAKNNVIISSSLEELRVLLPNEIIQKCFTLTIITDDTTTDSYLALYLSGWMDFFSGLPYCYYILLVQLPSSLEAFDLRHQMLLELVYSLPKQSLFVIFQHGKSAINLSKLVPYRATGYGPHMIYHVNHEQPWMVNNHVNNFDFVFPSIADLNHVYSSYSLVLRNYYYEDLKDSCVYVPVGAPYYSYIINNATSTVNRFKAASQRRFMCYFRGRVNYQAVNQINSQGQAVFSESAAQSERAYLFKMQMENRLPNCTFHESYIVSTGEIDMDTVEFYERYMSELSETSFALCPGGNNPETFRLHEALEMGAIPVLVRTPFIERDFLQRKPCTRF